MTPVLPNHAVEFFGPTAGPRWGGVPWVQAAAASTGSITLLQRPWNDCLALFDAADVLILSGTVDDDTDGPGGSTDIDPCYDPTTSLCWPNGQYINSRTFRGMVMHRVVENCGGGVGDFGLSCWNGILHAVQYYDVGPLRKLQEGSEKILRDFGVIEDGQSSWHGAVVGNDVQDFSSLIFLGSAPKDVQGQPYAVEQDEMIARTLALWSAFTGRSAANP